MYFQEIFTYELDFYDWRAASLFGNNSDGTSDPYVQFSISGDWSKFFTKGGYFGRKTTSPIVMGTLFPRWEECGTLKYRGTRSELENEDLVVRVSDWNRLGDVKIGHTMIPLRGILDYGFLKSQLARSVKVKEHALKVKKNLPAGIIEGSVRALDMPMHVQTGDIVVLKPDHQYLAIHVVNCNELHDCEMGYSNPFVVVEWDHLKQETRIIERELNPYFDETLYFPVRVINMDSAEFEKKENVKLSVYHRGSQGNDFLGAVEVPLFAILMSKVEKIQEFGGTKSRSFRGTLRLQNLGELTMQTMSVQVYFVPDLPSSVVLQEKAAAVEARQLPPEYGLREEQWKATITRLGKMVGNANYRMKAVDEKLCFRFLPTFLTPIIPPRQLRDPLVLSRMIQCMTWAEDADIYKGQSDVWTSPNFFLDLRKGDAEDHAILMCNVMLGSGMDAYLCVGTTRSGVRDYVWVMVREGDGSVSFWETTTAKRYVCPGRWDGLGQSREDVDRIEIDVDEFVEYSRETLKASKDLTKKRRKVKMASAVSSDGPEGAKKDETVGVLAAAMSPATPPRKSAADVVFFDSDRCLPPKDVMAGLIPDSSINADTMFSSVDDSAGGNDAGGVALSPVSVPYSRLDVVFNHRNLWANVQDADPALIKYDLDDLSAWQPFVTTETKIPDPAPFYEVKPIGPKIAVTRGKAMQRLVFLELKSGYMVSRHKAGMETKIFAPLLPILEEGLLVMENLRVMNPLVVDAIKKKTKETAEELVKVEEEHERHVLSLKMKDLKTANSHYDLDYWRGKLMASVPKGFEFQGTPMWFAYTDHKRIRKAVMERCDYHQDSDEKVQFAMAAHIASYPHSVNSVWVYVAKLSPAVTG